MKRKDYAKLVILLSAQIYMHTFYYFCNPVRFSPFGESSMAIPSIIVYILGFIGFTLYFKKTNSL